jgi:hypothetical protein
MTRTLSRAKLFATEILTEMQERAAEAKAKGYYSRVTLINGNYDPADFVEVWPYTDWYKPKHGVN